MLRRFVKKWYKATRHPAKSWRELEYQTHCYQKLYERFPMGEFVAKGWMPINWLRVRETLHKS